MKKPPQTIKGYSTLEMLAEALEIDEQITVQQAKRKQISQKQSKEWKEKLKKFLEALKDLIDLDIVTTVEGPTKSTYSTKIKFDGDIENTFPSTLDDKIWVRYNTMVDAAWQVRRELAAKILDIILKIISKIP